MQTLPTLFVSHGAPTFALDPGVAGPNLAELGPRPQAVLVVSPHWMILRCRTRPEAGRSREHRVTPMRTDHVR